jgi:ribosomal protein S18 acetylase RimI-like enzyme
MTAPTLYVRKARREDIDTIYKWRYETAAWLAEKYGTDQWSTEYPREKLEHWVDRGETYMVSLEPDGEPIATITSSSEGDPELWTPEELAEPARYVSKANVVREQAGRGIGATLLAWTRHKAAEEGAKCVRIDVWTTNTRLQAFYRQLGFEHLRTVPVTSTGSGALFEVTARTSKGLQVVQTDGGLHQGHTGARKDQLANEGEPVSMPDDVIDAYNAIAGSTERFKREVEEIVRSYRHTWDVLGELLQNGIDAIHRQSLTSPDNYEGRIRIEIDSNNLTVAVHDNGCGLTQSQIPKALAPSGSFKTLGQDYGYKGFGLTFACFASQRFTIDTLSSGLRSRVSMTGAIDWLSDKSSSPERPPTLDWEHQGQSADGESGTTIQVQLDAGNYQAKFGAIAALDGMFEWATVPKSLEYVLRTRTAVGCTARLFGRQPQVPIIIEVSIDKGSDFNVPYGYLLPDESIYVLGAYYSDIDAYVSRFTDGTLSRDAKKFRGLRYNVMQQEVGTLRKVPFDAVIFVCGRTGMTRLAREFDIESQVSELKLSTGVQLALGGMPTGISIEDWESRGSFEQRFFILVDADLGLSDQLDSGRKGISRYFAQLIVQRLEDLIGERQFGGDKQVSLRKLSQNMSEPGADPTSDLSNIADIVDQRRSQPRLALQDLTVQRHPVDENEVIALFFELCARDLIRGYRLVYLTQFYKYDAAFEFKVPLSEDILFDPADPARNPLGLGNAARDRMAEGDNTFEWRDRKGSTWIVTEFKPKVEDLLGNATQRVEDIELLVTWDFNKESLAKKEALLEELTPQERRLHGITHRLTYEGYDCDCIVLSEVIRIATSGR